MSNDPSIQAQLDKAQRKVRKLRMRSQKQRRQAWAEGFLAGVCGALRSGDLCIDLGANVGDVSARLLATGADVIAYDPEPWAVAQLQERFRAEPRFELHHAAVGVTDGEVLLHRAADFDGDEAAASVKSTVLVGGRAMDDTATVAVRQVDFVAALRQIVAARGPVAFLKMDIEGAELDLLETMDAAGLIGQVRTMVVETHEAKFKSLRPRYRALRQRFEQIYAKDHVCLDWI